MELKLDIKKKSSQEIANEIMMFIDALHPLIEKPIVLNLIKKHYRKELSVHEY